MHFWHTYVAQHPSASGGISVDPGMLFAACLCLFALALWAAYQSQSRCQTCGAWPARCRCHRPTNC
jgi:hypothetical protein